MVLNASNEEHFIKEQFYDEISQKNPLAYRNIEGNFIETKEGECILISQNSDPMFQCAGVDFKRGDSSGKGVHLYSVSIELDMKKETFGVQLFHNGQKEVDLRLNELFYMVCKNIQNGGTLFREGFFVLHMEQPFEAIKNAYVQHVLPPQNREVDLMIGALLGGLDWDAILSMFPEDGENEAGVPSSNQCEIGGFDITGFGKDGPLVLDMTHLNAPTSLNPDRSIAPDMPDFSAPTSLKPDEAPNLAGEPLKTDGSTGLANEPLKPDGGIASDKSDGFNSKNLGRHGGGQNNPDKNGGHPRV